MKIIKANKPTGRSTLRRRVTVAESNLLGLSYISTQMQVQIVGTDYELVLNRDDLKRLMDGYTDMTEMYERRKQQ